MTILAHAKLAMINLVLVTLLQILALIHVINFRVVLRTRFS